MNQLINILNQDGQLVVTSRQIAEDFEKEHKDVVNNVEKLMGGIGKSSDTLFIETQYQNEQNKQWYKEYLLTRDGFSLLVMGFTGTKALQWKLKYIEAFNKMENSLKEIKPLGTMDLIKLQLKAMEEQEVKIKVIDEKVDKLENDMPLFQVDCKELQAEVRKKGIITLGGK